MQLSDQFTIVMTLKERQAWQKQIGMQPKRGAGAETLLEDLDRYFKVSEKTVELQEYWNADVKKGKQW